MTKFYWLLGTVAVLGIAAVGYSVGSNALGKAATEPVEVAGLDNMETLVSLAQGVTKGDPAARITIAEFSDYQCPGCGAFALTVKPQLDLLYVQTGKAKFVYYDYPLISIHPHSFLAARAGRCANDQGKFWEFQSVIFRNQSTWSTKTQVEGDFVDYAVEAGAEKGAFEACLKSDAHADVVSANLRLAEQLGIEGTPTVMISMGRGMARRLMSFDFESIKGAIEALLAEATPAPADSAAVPGR
jgi:protein-disulfide isomerase